MRRCRCGRLLSRLFSGRCLWPHGCSGRRRARPPARLGPHFVRRRASKPGQAPPPPTGTAARSARTLRCPPRRQQWGFCAMRSPLAACRRRVGGLDGVIPPPCGGEAALFHVNRPISHVIPLRVFQALKSHRWDCNVCGVSRKMTMLNYVRLGGEVSRARPRLGAVRQAVCRCCRAQLPGPAAGARQFRASWWQPVR